MCQCVLFRQLRRRGKGSQHRFEGTILRLTLLIVFISTSKSLTVPVNRGWRSRTLACRTDKNANIEQIYRPHRVGMKQFAVQEGLDPSGSKAISNRSNATQTKAALVVESDPPEIAGEEWSWETARKVTSAPYISEALNEIDDKSARQFFRTILELTEDEEDLEDCMTVFLASADGATPESCSDDKPPENVDPLWEQTKLEAQLALEREPMAGPQLYQGILSQPALLPAVCSIIANEIATELVPATAIKNLFCTELTLEDERCIHFDIMAAAVRSPSVGTALSAVLFNRGLHALVCHRVAHRLWQEGRTGFAKYMQSKISQTYSADIHPAAVIGAGIYMNAGSGIVIGETAVVGDDVSILQGVTLGGTGKECGDRHPKVGNGVILSDSSTVLGNIKVRF
jgi:serine O-acetyltransferase